MAFQVVSEAENQVVLDLNKWSYLQANSLRRYLMSECTFVAPTNVMFMSNTSLLSDETIAQRIGLCPMLNYSEDPGPFLIDVEGPGNVNVGHVENSPFQESV